MSKGFNYGEGFFTTIKVENKVPENFELHLARIKSSLDYFSFTTELPDFINLIDSILKANKLKDARIKITFFITFVYNYWLIPITHKNFIHYEPSGSPISI